MKQTRRRFLSSAIAIGVIAAVPGRLSAIAQAQLSENLLPQLDDSELSEFTIETLRRMSEAMGVPYSHLTAYYREFLNRRCPGKNLETPAGMIENKKGTPQHP